MHHQSPQSTLLNPHQPPSINQPQNTTNPAGFPDTETTDKVARDPTGTLKPRTFGSAIPLGQSIGSPWVKSVGEMDPDYIPFIGERNNLITNH